MPDTAMGQETIKLLIEEIAKLSERVYSLENQRLAHQATFSIVFSHLGQIQPLSVGTINKYIRDYAIAVEASGGGDPKVVRRRLAIATELRTIANVPTERLRFEVIPGGKLED